MRDAGVLVEELEVRVEIARDIEKLISLISLALMSPFLEFNRAILR